MEAAAEGGFNVVAVWKAAESVNLTKLREPLVGTGADSGVIASAPAGTEVVVHTAQPPVLCTGFEGSVASAAKDLFNFAVDKARAAPPYSCT